MYHRSGGKPLDPTTVISAVGPFGALLLPGLFARLHLQLRGHAPARRKRMPIVAGLGGHDPRLFHCCLYNMGVCLVLVETQLALLEGNTPISRNRGVFIRGLPEADGKYALAGQTQRTNSRSSSREVRIRVPSFFCSLL